MASINPPAATIGVTLTLIGTGFDAVTAANNLVNFTGSATPVAASDAGGGYVEVVVPLDAATGPVTVTSGGDTSNGVPFIVLVPTTTTIDDVLATAQTGSGAKGMTVTPDGAVSYAVSPDGDVVIPVEVDSFTTLPSIPVGDEPVAIVMHPDGKEAFVANFGSASMSVINTDPNVPLTYNTVIQTIVVGSNPIDVAVQPDGSRVYCVNLGTEELSVIDADQASSTHLQVLATVKTGSGSKSLTTTPDGSKLYIGLGDGFEIYETEGFQVLATVKTGSGSKSLTTTPDGTILFVLTDGGDVLIIDIDPNSSSANQVLATVKTGSGSKSLTTTPDGALLYIVQDGTDEVIVVAVNVEGGVSVLEEGIEFPPPTVNVAFVDTIQTGDDPAAVVFHPSGNGTFWISTPGDLTITKYGRAFSGEVVTADLVFKPNSTDLIGYGKCVVACISIKNRDVNDIDVSSIRLQGVVAPIPGSEIIEDHNGDGEDDLIVKFDRAAYQDAVPQGEFTPVTVTGNIAPDMFEGTDVVDTRRPIVIRPNDEDLQSNQIFVIEWDSPKNFPVESVNIDWTCDGGVTWMSIAEGITDDGFFEWLVPLGLHQECCIVVTLFDKKDNKPHLGINPIPFRVVPPVPVSLSRFDVQVVEGAALMYWATSYESAVQGFELWRASEEDGLYKRVNASLIRAHGNPEGSEYEFADATIQPNNTYFYKLLEITPGGQGATFGPYKAVYTLATALEANVPNPFNPTTTIKYSLATNEFVSLNIYDVRGRLIRTMVRDNQVGGVYRVEWDGRSNGGEQVASGMYFYRLQAGAFTKTRKMLLLK